MFEQCLVDMIFAGVLQSAFAALAAGAILPHRNRRILLRRFVFFNLLLFGWSILGVIVLNHLTAHKLAVLGDAPVWTAVFPFGRIMLDHAAGGSDGWQLLAGTSMSHLRWLWVATVAPVWLLAALSFLVLLRARSVHPVSALD